MDDTVPVHVAKTQLSKLLARVEAGEVITIVPRANAGRQVGAGHTQRKARIRGNARQISVSVPSFLIPCPMTSWIDGVDNACDCATAASIILDNLLRFEEGRPLLNQSRSGARVLKGGERPPATVSRITDVLENRRRQTSGTVAQSPRMREDRGGADNARTGGPVMDGTLPRGIAMKFASWKSFLTFALVLPASTPALAGGEIYMRLVNTASIGICSEADCRNSSTRKHTTRETYMVSTRILLARPRFA